MQPVAGGHLARLKIPLDEFKDQLNKILIERDNLGAYTAGQPSDVRPQMRHFTLGWFQRIENLLHKAVDPASYALSLQSNRYMAILEDRLPFDGLYRAMDDEMKLVAAQLEELLAGFESLPTPTLPFSTTTSDPGVGGHAPRAFICHGSEDKDRFVVAFSARLRARGIDAWLDQWEIRAGDSLIRRIFDEAFGDCDAFVVVLSLNSVDKPWVRLELDTAIIKRIQEGARLIPVVLDNVIVPEVLKSIKWVPVADTSQIEDAVDEVVRTIHGIKERPPLGDPPGYLTGPSLYGLDAVDSTVLRLLVESAIERDADQSDDDACVEAASRLAIDLATYEISLQALENAGLVSCQRGMNGYRTPASITESGFRRSLPFVIPNLEEIRRSLIGLLINEFSSGAASDVLANRLGAPRRVVIVMLRELALRKLLLVSEYLPNGCSVANISPLLAREAS